MKPYIEINSKLRTEMDSSVFGKTVENVRNHRDIKLVTKNKGRNQLVSEPNYHTTNTFQKTY